MDTDQLVGKRVHVRADELIDVTIVAEIRAVEPDSSSLLLEFVPPAQIGTQTYLFAVARPRLERDDLGTLLSTGVLSCGVTCISQARYDPTRPFDLSWWRGGGAALADLVLQ